VAVGVTGTARADVGQSLVGSGNDAAAVRGTTAGVAMLDRRTGVYSENGTNAHLRFGSASVVKLFIADSVLRRASLGQLALSQADRDALGRMLRSSDDAAASSFWSRFGANGIVDDVISRYHLAETTAPANPRYWGLTQITAHDMVAFYSGMLSGSGGLSAGDRDVIVGHLRQSTQRGTDGVYQWFGLHDGLPRESTLGIKQGWMCCFSDGAIWRHSTGIVGPDARYVVVVLTRDPGSAGAAHTEASVTKAVQTMFPAGLVPRVQGGIAELWYASGGPSSSNPVGLPVSEELPATGGVYNQFERGAIYWSPATGAHWIRGDVLQTYRSQGSEDGFLGYPTTNEVPTNGGARHGFQNGAIYWSPSTGGHWIRGSVLQSFLGAGAENGPLGYPTSNELAAGAGGAWQQFQKGLTYWSPSSGAHWIRGGVLQAYKAARAENGPLGYPVGDELLAAGGAWQEFQKGRVYWSPSTGAHSLYGPVLQAWLDRGAEKSALGYPLGEPHQVSGGTRVDFQHGSLTIDPSGRVVDAGAAATTASSSADTARSAGTAVPATPTAPATTTAPAPTSARPSTSAPSSTTNSAPATSARPTSSTP
jgi:uncharacterized protein with LGFP repeats